MFDWKLKAHRVEKDFFLLQPVYKAFGGLCEFWSAVLIISTVVLEFMKRLEPSFAAAITAICGILAIHDALDDRLPPVVPSLPTIPTQTTQVVNDITVDAGAKS